MKKYPTNEERTLEYLSNFNREKTIKKLINKKDPIIFDVGANDGISLLEFYLYGMSQLFTALNRRKNVGPY